MGLSSNSLIHFTDSKEKLSSILTGNFRIKYCKEEIDFDERDNPIVIASPMVSFCDIPLSEIKTHLNNYGPYGIGLTKEWGNRSGLNPVLYIEVGSNLAQSFFKFYDQYIYDEDLRVEDLDEMRFYVLDMMRYMKNYENVLIRKGEIIKNYRFSDEREWRYVPGRDARFDMQLSEDFYSSDEQKKEANERLEKIRLTFNADDIKYIIIKNDSEIPEFIDTIRRSKGNIYSHIDEERLMTRFLTSEQILTDF